MPRKSVLVTGGAGYIGSHAVLALRDAGYPVVVIDNLSTGLRSAVPDDVEFIEGDIADVNLVTSAMSRSNVYAIMHFAGSIVVPESVQQPLKYYENNTAHSRALIEAAVACEIPHFIFSSTATIYGLPDQFPIPETAPLQPINPYGTSKLMTEWMLRDAAAAHGFNYGVLRYFNVAGADPGGRAGQSTAGATHLIKVAAEAAVGKRDSVSVFGTDYDTPDGTGVRDYVHVSDLAEAHLLLLQKLAADPGASHILNCGYGSGYSVLEVLDAVEKVSGKTIKRQLTSRRAGDPPKLVADTRKIKSILGWRPQYDDLRTIAGHALDWEVHPKLSEDS